MRFSSNLILLAAATGVHSLVTPRDAQLIIGVFTNVQNAIDNLDTAVKGYTTDPAPLLDTSNKLDDAIKTGTTTVSGSDNLTLSDSISLLKPVQTLKTHAQTLVNDLKDKKPQFQAQTLCSVVRGQIATINTDSKSLIDATVSKVPAAAQDIARQQAQGITDVLNDAQNAFSEQNCVDTA